MKHLINLARVIHRNGLGVSYLVTGTWFAYPITMPLVAPLAIAMFCLDPEDFNRHEEKR